MFYKTLTNEPLKAFYGEKHVLRAAEAQAIEVLLISDKLFRAQDVAKRKIMVKLVDDVREYGGEVKIFSSMHVSGEQLEQLTGICAILRFPMQELEDSDSEDEWKFLVVYDRIFVLWNILYCIEEPGKFSES